MNYQQLISSIESVTRRLEKLAADLDTKRIQGLALTNLKQCDARIVATVSRKL